MVPVSILSRLFSPSPPPLSQLWGWITATARQPRWYADHGVADTLDGRFDMVALVTALVMLELERRGHIADTALLTERFTADMDGSLRAIGISDMAMGKQMGRVLGALEGRLGAYRAALADDAAPDALTDALRRNVYRGDASGSGDELAAAVRTLNQRILRSSDDELRQGEIA